MAFGDAAAERGQQLQAVTEATSGGRREIHLRYLVDGSLRLN